ncbi:hypothetical protein F5Y10DRAFT_246746 [Nemania abortiva]|nr:hypothetical protein F5Y10DRAFT_246746 [Nemania abortiva]
MFNKPQLEAIDLPTNHDIFTEHDSSDIAERIGLPIFTKRCFPHPNWASEKNWDVFRGEIPYSNLDAGFLHMGCDPEAEFDHSGRTAAWGCPSVPWTWGVGSVIVVRQDKKPLLPLHVEALCKYCSCDAAPYMAHSTGMFEPEEPMSKDLVLSIICRPAFIIRWHKVVGEKREKGEIVDVPSPYDV